MALKTSAVTRRIAPNLVAQIFERAQALRAEGRAICDLSIGEPDFDTPDSIKQAAVEAIRRGETKYTAGDGTLVLKASIAAKYEARDGVCYPPEALVADGGCKNLLALLMRCLLDPGDRIVVPVPCYGGYAGMIGLLGAEMCGLPCGVEGGFRLEAEALAASLDQHRPKVLLLNTPHNPTGVVYRNDELQAFARVLEDYPDVWVIVDEVYEHLLYDGVRFASLAALAPALRSRLVTVNSASKSYAMTGWRLGYAAGPVDLMNLLRGVIAQASSHPSSVTQAAVAAALSGDHGYLADWCRSYQRRRNLLIDGLAPISGLRTVRPQGGMFAYFHCGALLGRHTPEGKTLSSSSALANYLLDAANTVAIPGLAFGLDPYIRFSFVASEQTIRTAIGQMVPALESLA